MATIIDALIVELSLDPKKFKEGQKEAVEQLRKLEEQAKRGGANISSSVGSVEQSFALLQKRLIGVSALLFGGLSIDRFIEKMKMLNTQTANVSGWFGTSAQNIQAWSQVAERAGVAGGAAAQGFAAISQQRARWQNLREPGGLLQFQRGANLSGNKVDLFGGQDKLTLLPNEEVATRLHNWLQTEIKAGRGTTGRAALRDVGGLSEDFITMLANPNMQKMLESAKKNVPTDEQVKRYQELTNAIAGATQSIETLARDAIDPLIPPLKDFAEWITKIVNFWRNDPETKKQVEKEGEELHEDLQKRFGKTDGGGEWWERLNRWMDEKLGGAIRDNTDQLRELNQKLGKGGIGHAGFEGGAADGGGGLLHNIMFSGGGASGGGGAGGGAGGGPRWPGSGPGGRGGDGEGIPGQDGAGLGGSEYLKAQRSGLQQEIDKNPDLRKELAGMMATEGTPLQSMESLANRTVATNEWRKTKGLKPLSLRQMLHSGFYGPINRGALPGAIRGLERDPKRMQQMQDAIDSVLKGGSNTVLGATDQGMPSDPNGRHVGSDGFRLRGRGNVFNDWGGGGGHEFNERWRRDTQRRVRESAPTGIGSQPPPTPPPDPRRGMEWTNLLNSTHLAAYSPGADGGISTANNMTVGSVHVHTAATDAQGIASAIKPALHRFAGIMSSNNGPT